ncbi:MAG: NAD(+) synthase, partial [Muribaculaceae bacterium]|nr:NAD(+) synthase [Muribaculaceae bacterium]
VPVSVSQLVRTPSGVLVGAEICEDLWSPAPPSTVAALAGAEILVNLSASDDLIGKHAYLRSLVTGQSARCIAAYAYASAGYGESSTDLVFDAKLMIAENGTMLAENARWTRETQLTIADVDIEALRRDRMHIRTFGACSDHTEATRGMRRVALGGPSVPFTEDELLRDVDPHPFVPADSDRLADRCEEILSIQSAGLAKRLDVTRCKTLVIGVSGGLDSTLALLVAVRAFDFLGLDRRGIIGITMPGFGTTDRTHDNAVNLMDDLGVTRREINIGKAVMQHFSDIGQNPAVHDVTYENSQARERTQLLMDVANKEGGMVLGTGDLSELALGWATYNGDHMSMYGVNSGVPKTLVKHLVKYFAMTAAEEAVKNTLLDIIDTPISPELIPADAQGNIVQKTEDLVGPYELHDFFLYYTLRYGFSPRRIYLLARKAFGNSYDSDTIKHWLKTFFRRFFSQQFKRSCLPDGPKVGSVTLSPRGDWRMPSDASAAMWLDECENL